MRKYKIILILFLMALILYSVPVALKKGMLLAPDEAAFLTTARNLIEETSFYIQNSDYIYNEKYNTDVFGHKVFNYIPQKGMVQQYPFGLSILLAFFGKLCGGYMEYVVPFIGAIGVIIFYLLNKLYFNKEQALYAALLLMVMPGYFYWSTFIMADVPSVVFFILGLFLLEIFFRTKKTIWLMLCGIIYGFSICLKYTNFILLPAVFIYFFIKRGTVPGFKRKLFVACIAFIIPILVLMAYHQHIYHNPFITGYHAENLSVHTMLEPDAITQTKLGTSIFSVIPINFKSLVKHILGFPLQAAILFPYVLFGIIALFYLLKDKRPLFYLIITTVSLLFLFNANVSSTYGSAVGEMNMRSSYLRYLLLGFVLLIIPVAFFIYDFRGAKLTRIGMLSILLFSSIFNNFGPVPRDNFRLNYKRDFPAIWKIRKELLHNAPEQSVIFSRYAAKYLLPNRAIVPPQHASLKKVVNITGLLLRDSVNVYFIDDGKDVGKSNFFMQATNKKVLNEEIKLYQVISIDSRMSENFD